MKLKKVGQMPEKPKCPGCKSTFLEEEYKMVIPENCDSYNPPFHTTTGRYICSGCGAILK